MHSTSQKIVFLGGYSRNGSTVIGRTLAEADGTVCVGETQYVWSRGLAEDANCNCGRPFRSCAFWAKVGEAAFGGWNNTDVERLAQCESDLNRFRKLPSIFAAPRGFSHARDDYETHLSSVYDAIFRVSGAEVVVDTSKHPSFAGLLIRVNERHARDLRIVHLVRDSRAVAHSWTRSKPLPSPLGGRSSMPRFHPAISATRWLRWNLAFHVIEARTEGCMRMRYESFVAEPRRALEAIGAGVEVDFTLPESRLADGRVNLSNNHIFSGNPMRAQTGWMPLKVDDEWRTAFPRRRRAAVTAITWPLLRRYGYAP